MLLWKFRESAKAMIRRLEDLVAPLTEREFLDSFAQKQRLLVKATDPDRAASLLPWATINHLIDAGGMPSSRIDLIVKGQTLPEPMYRRDGQLHTDSLHQLAAQGASIVLNGIDNYVPAIATLADSVERRMAHAVAVNCYITFGTSSAFKPHYDTHDVIAVQIRGVKRWRGYGISVPYPVFGRHRGSELVPGQQVWEELIEPGDVLYVPRGEGHDVVCEIKPSVHLTIGLYPPNGIDLLTWLAQRAGNDPLFRMDITRVSGQEALNDHGQSLKRRLHGLIDQLSFDAFLNDSDLQRQPRARLSLGLDGVLRSDSWLAPTPRRRINLAGPIEAEIELTIGGKTIRLSAGARRILHWLLENDGLSLGALAEELMMAAEDDHLHQAIAELVAKGLVAVDH
jgi:ribosomal protein L16 Arg81 hydroxylase